MKPVQMISGAVAVGAAIFIGGAATMMSDTTTRDVAGVITEGGDLGVYKMQVGDCINDTTLADGSDSVEAIEVSSLKAVPCGETHNGEVTGVVDTFYQQTEYTSDDELFEQALSYCVTSLEEYSGQDYQDSLLDTFAMYPSADTWKIDNDRGIVCVGTTVDEDYQPTTSTGSIKAA